MGFFLRKLVGLSTTPSFVLSVVIAAGTLALLSERWREKGRRLLAAGVVSLALVAVGFPFDLIGGRLEARYPAIVTPGATDALVGVEWVAVLGGGHDSRGALPVTSVPNEASLARIVEGVRLHRAMPGSRLIFSGYGGTDAESSAEVGARLARSLGVQPGRIRLEPGARTTAEEAEAVRRLVGDGPVVLVTSAVHLPRAVRLFESAGVSVVPSPTEHRARGPRSLREVLTRFPDRVDYADAVVHELLGLLAIRLGLD